MFESKLKMYTLQKKSSVRKVFWLFTEKVWKKGHNKGKKTKLKLYYAFVNDQTQNIVDPCQGLCQLFSIDIKYIDIAQNVATHWAIIWDTVNFPEPEEKRANFKSYQESEEYVPKFYSKWVYF